jgi:hypothetical protein
MTTSPGPAFDPQVGWTYERVRKLKDGRIKIRAVETEEGPIEGLAFEMDVPDDTFDRCFTEELPPIDTEELTREELISICEAAIVPQAQWHDRDSQKSQAKLGEAWALLKADCEFWIDEEMMADSTGRQTIWIRIRSKGFNYFELGDDNYNVGLYYLPTRARLEQAKGKDWY